MRTAKLDEIVRQKDPALKSAVEMLATGQVSAALESLSETGPREGDSRYRRAHPRDRQKLYLNHLKRRSSFRRTMPHAAS